MVTALPPPSPGTPWAVGLVGFGYYPPTIREGLSGVDCILINDLVYCIAKVGWTMPPEAPNDVIDRVNFLDRAVLAPVVRGVLNDESACPIQGWTAQPIGGSIGVGTPGIFKLIGEATTSAGISKWSVVAKVMDLDASAEGLAHTSPLREVRAYESGILAAICSATKPENSFRAANHYGVTEIDDLGSILWVEDPSAALPSPWEDDTYLEITRQIGHFNASWELNPPERKSWFLDDIVASKLEPRVHLLTSVGDYLDDALVQRALPPENVANLANLTKVMPSVFRLLNTGPRPLGHFDAQPQNLFPIRTEKGGIEAVAIDWASLGYAPLGLDAPLVIGSSLSWCEFDADHGKYLHPRALDSYLDGLGQMGWRGDTQLVRLAYMTGAVEHAAFYAMFPALWVDQPDWKTKFVDLMEKPPETLVDQWRDAFASVYPLFESELASQGL